LAGAFIASDAGRAALSREARVVFPPPAPHCRAKEFALIHVTPPSFGSARTGRFLNYLEEDDLRGSDPEAHQQDGIRVISAGPNAFL
jgi:hypothetical protein